MTTRLVFVIALAMLACATPYQRQGYRGGFSETQLDENVFRVSFNGNGFTSGGRAVDFALLRSAELARERGYHYFVIVEKTGGYSYSSYTTPTQSHTTGTATSYGNTTHVNATTTTTGGETHLIAKPGVSNTIVCLKQKPENFQGMVYNADFLYLSLSQKYGIAPDGYAYTAPPGPDGLECVADKDCVMGQWCGRMDASSGRGTCIPMGQR